mmetsp:Transcript_2796/g.4521  ORF Transcript_2796/g.4521 Transcript_2796/m.4521 type:complete len:581 (-) Transcript_2796:196-1938(-)|eukprot:CAMPEP_0119013366 /NCGR_PEP_ID=MMETSP1176-20130426/8410_1 /TAXON_ID=265551 /ORGANISM="Synedropsis recta cf, Strain CCMP1620" /LENGTH=580 /DNA_ID=CAMNT_0006966455 /DNA_START=211 /DNA_END=1953 /DNA_ORIENTATION=+
MFPTTQYLGRSSCAAVAVAAAPATATATTDESRPTRGRNNKRFSVRKDIMKVPRLFVPLNYNSSNGNNNSNSNSNNNNNGQATKRFSKRHAFKTTMNTTANNTTTTTTTTSNTLNAVVWMQSHDCPLDVLPKILAYAGPRKAQTLSRTNHFWNQLLKEEATWRQLCEELYKWKEGDAFPPRGSWKSFYRDTPCVPTDYSSIAAALAIASNSNTSTQQQQQDRSIRILLRPGSYYLKEAICIQAVGPNTTVAIETMVMPRINVIRKEHTTTHTTTDYDTTMQDHTSNMGGDRSTVSSSSSVSSIRQRASKFCRTFSSCRSLSGVIPDVDCPSTLSSTSSVAQPPFAPVRASLISKSRRSNEPILRVRQGTVHLVNINICHNSHGVDIWNGNAAIQIQPPLGPDDIPLATTSTTAPPTCRLKGVNITSKSGRGICNMDGGLAIISHCYVHDCAATGIYVGGPGSHALIERTDVTNNGNGNRHARRGNGIARGHSGIYLEQGQCVVRDCNISQNSLTGISAVSQENAILSLEESDLIANGAQQLEMPPNGTLSRRRSLTRDNTLATEGLSRSRSGLIETVILN